MALAAFVPYLLLPANPFIADSTWISKDNAVVLEGSLADIWTSDFWGLPMDADFATRSYRPLVSTSYALTARTLGFDAAAFHLTDMALHMAAALLVALLLATLMPSSRWPIPLAVVFAVHPVLSEAVCSFVGRADLMASVAILAALLLHLKATSSARPWLLEGTTTLLVAAALLSKEYAVAAPFILVVVDIARIYAGQISREQRRQLYLSWGAAFGVLLLYLGLRYTLAGALGGVPMLGPGDMPLFGKSLGARWGTAAWLLLTALRLLVAPFHLNYFYGTGTLSIADGLLDAKALAGAAFVIAMLVLAFLSLRRRRQVTAVAAAALFFLPLGPTLNTVSVSGVLFAERFLYLPAVGFLLAMALLLERYLHRESSRRAAIYVIGLVALLFAGLTMARVADWKVEPKLIASGIAAYPMNTTAHIDLARHLFSKRNPARDVVAAAEHYEKALEIEQRNPRLWTFYADALTELGRYDEALSARRHAKELSPADVPAIWLWLGEAELRVGNTENAIQAFRRVLKLEPENNLVPTYLGNALLRLSQQKVLAGEKDEAIALVNEAIDTAALPGEGVFLSAQIVSRAGQAKRAAELYATALGLDQDILRRRHRQAIELGKSGKHLHAAQLFREILDAQPDHARTLFNLGRSLVLAGRAREAIAPLRRGLQLQDDASARRWLERARREAR